MDPVAPPSADCAPSVAIVTNPRSRQNRRAGTALGRALAGLPGLCEAAPETPAALDEVVTGILQQHRRTVVLNGGDGSVQQFLSSAARLGCLARLPPLVLLPGGTTNMTAHALNGERLSYGEALQRLRERLGRAGAPRTVMARAVSVELAGELRVGFFFGLGAILKGIDYTQARIYRAGIAGEEASGLALARTAWGILRGDSGFMEPTHLELQAEQRRRCGDVTLLLVSTLPRLFLGIRPYWGPGAGALRTTLVGHPPHRLLRNLPALLRGRPNAFMRPSTGYESWAERRLLLRARGADGGAARFTIDGEIFETADGSGGAAPLRIEASPPLTVVPLGDGRAARVQRP